MKLRKVLVTSWTIILAGMLIVSCQASEDAVNKTDSTTVKPEESSMTLKIQKSEEELRAQLTPEQFNVCVMKGTEKPFTGKYYDFDGDGMYSCAVCGNILFDSKTKYHSGSGWPSFFEPFDSTRIGEAADTSFGMERTEIVCNKCGAHLGHVFPDGPQPTGLRYCVNSASLDFVERERADSSSTTKK